MNQAETLEPLPYFTTAEEKYLAFHKDTLIGGNIRIWLKEKETERLQDAWRKLKVQGRLFRRFPQQIQILTKSIKKSSIKRAEGNAWIFFIFAACDCSPSTSVFTHTVTTHEKSSAISAKETLLKQLSIYFYVQHSEKSKIQ